MTTEWKDVLPEGTTFEDMGRAVGGVAATGMSGEDIADSIAIAKAGINKLNIDTVLFMGASILDAMVSGYESNMQEELLRRGIKASVVSSSVPGRASATCLSDWEAMKATYTGLNVLVVVSCVGNDVSATHPYSSATESELNDITNNVNNLMVSIMANGNTPLIANTTFRRYDGDPSVNKEELGCKPYNDAIVTPTSEKLAPKMYYKAPVVDFYDLTRNLNDIIQGPDMVHYQLYGYHMLRQFLLDNVVNRILGLPPETVARVEDPTTPLSEPMKSLLLFDGYTIGSTEVYGAYALQTVPSDIDGINIGAMEGYTANAITVDFKGTQLTTGSNGTVLNNGDVTQSLTNDYIKSKFMHNQNDSLVEFLGFNGFSPGQAVNIYVAAYRDSASTDRTGIFSVDGGVSVFELDASNNNTGSHILTLSAIADSSGRVSLMGMRKTVGGYAYVNGVIVEPK